METSVEHLSTLLQICRRNIQTFNSGQKCIFKSKYWFDLSEKSSSLFCLFLIINNFNAASQNWFYLSVVHLHKKEKKATINVLRCNPAASPAGGTSEHKCIFVFNSRFSTTFTQTNEAGNVSCFQQTLHHPSVCVYCSGLPRTVGTFMS